MAKTKKESIPEEVSVEQKLRALYSLQQIDSQIDKIKIVRGELPQSKIRHQRKRRPDQKLPEHDQKV